WNQVIGRAIYSHNVNDSAFLYGINCPGRSRCRSRLYKQVLPCNTLHRIPRRSGTHSVNTYVGAKPVGGFLNKEYRIFKRPEVIGLALSIIAYKLEPVFQVINYNHPSGTEEPGALCSHDANRTRSKYHHRVARFNSPHFGGLIAGRKHICKQDSIVGVHVGRYNGRAHVGVRHAHIFRLSTVVSTGSMRVSKNAPYSSRLRIRLMAVSIQLLAAKGALPTSNIKRYHDMVAHF